jgi:hypothetical protein
VTALVPMMPPFAARFFGCGFSLLLIHRATLAGGLW